MQSGHAAEFDAIARLAAVFVEASEVDLADQLIAVATGEVVGQTQPEAQEVRSPAFVDGLYGEAGLAVALLDFYVMRS